MSIQTFAELDLIEPLQRALRAEDYTTPTPIQAQAIPQLLKGRDLLGCAQTGTGKTAAFALPILQKLAAIQTPLRPKSVRALVLTPTRELALQINDSFRTYGRHLRISTTVVMGGVGHVPQIKALSRGLDVLIATPGRLNDLLVQGHVRFDQLEVFVLDEADRMLDMGFIRDVRKVVAALPTARQTMLFSATMPDDIARLAQSILKEPVRVEVTPVSSTAERIEQKVLFVDKGAKHKLLAQVLNDTTIDRAIIFTRTKHGANKVGEVLGRGSVMAGVIHGNKSQSARQKALDDFRAGRSRVLVATDIAARGIDVDGITHVINFDLPNDPESYVHRIGRTARAGRGGFAISFCDASERDYLRDIEKLIRKRLPAENAAVQADARSSHNDQGGEHDRDRGRRHDGARRRHGDGKPHHGGHGEDHRGRKHNGEGTRHAAGASGEGRHEGHRGKGAHSQAAHSQGAHSQGGRPQGERKPHGHNTHGHNAHNPGGNGGRGRGGRRRSNRGRTQAAGAAA